MPDIFIQNVYANLTNLLIAQVTKSFIFYLTYNRSGVLKKGKTQKRMETSIIENKKWEKNECGS